MPSKKVFTYSQKQKQLLSLLHSKDKSEILAYGGSRSGKTYAIIRDMLYTAIDNPGSRQLLCRAYQTDLKKFLWLDNVKKVLDSTAINPETGKKQLCFPRECYHMNNQELYIIFENGSEIFTTGLDANNSDKIFGSEYCTIFINEASQLEYNTIQDVKTRLAQQIPDFKRKLILDENPPAPTHFTHRIFIEGIDPVTGKPLADKSKYASILMNPGDNPLLDQDYLDTLNSMDDRRKRRFLFGEFCKASGAVFESFDIAKCSVDINWYQENVKPECFVVGADTNGNNKAAIFLALYGDKIYVCDELCATKDTMANFNINMLTRWGACYIGYGDPAAGALNDELANFYNADNAVEAGLNYLLEKIEQGNFFVLTENGYPLCPVLVDEMESYHRDEKGSIVKKNDHNIDGLRYGAYSHRGLGAQLFSVE